MSDEQLAREHAQACWRDPIGFAAKGPRTVPYVQAALAELERIQSQDPGMVGALLDGGNEIARQLNADAFQGFREIVQNADDLGASNVRVGVRTARGKRRLLIVHDGAPVELMHVLPMIYPSISTKRNKARAKGRFGVGLKTLSRLGSGLTVHSAPYHFTARDNFAVRTTAARAITGFYDPTQDTLITLDLEDDVEPDFLDEAFRSWSATELLFLDAVRRVTVWDLDAAELKFAFELAPHGDTSLVRLRLTGDLNDVEEERFNVSGRTWVRFSADVAVPAGLERARKATDPTTRISIALPEDGDAQGRVYIALPTRILTGVAFSLDAQFNPATSREELSNDKWNRWLVQVVTDFAGALTIELLRAGSPLAWFLAPVGAATNSTSEWLNERFRIGWAKAVKAIAVEPHLLAPVPFAPLSAISYAESDVDDLLDAADHLAVTGMPMLPATLRDSRGRWRHVVESLGVSRRITLAAALRAAASELQDKPAAWLAELARRCLDAGDYRLLLETPWVPLASGGCAQPQPRDEAPELLVLGASDNALAARHGLFRMVHSALRDDAFEELLEWLKVDANLVERPDGEDILGAFAARFSDHPIDISREELVELRDLFASAPERGIEDLGARVGDALRIEAFRFEATPAGTSRQVRERAPPGKVYLPRSIEDETGGWSSAAGETPGLLWAAPGYAEVFKVTARRGRDAATRRVRGAKAFLTLLGARTAPRLQPVETPVDANLPALQASARRVVGRVAGFLREDYISPDLDRVLADVMSTPGSARGRTRRRRRGSSDERGVALFRCLTANWRELQTYSTADVVRASGYGGVLTSVPATWVARLAQLDWLVNEAGRLTRPMNLMIPTRIARAIEGDPARFAAGLDERDAAEPLATLLRMKVDPRASELVTAIEARRHNPGEGAADLMKIYRALSAYCPQAAGIPSPDARVGDLTVGSLRAKFGINRSRRGLIAGLVTNKGGDGWYAPTGVHSGKDIFHGRVPFVVSDRELGSLWRALNITSPEVGDCVRELELIARDPPGTYGEALLIDIYRHLDTLVSERLPAAERRQLASLPLLVGDRWATTRPIYLSEHHRAEVASLAVWSPPCAPGTIPNFVAAAGVEVLQVDDAPLSQVFGAGEDLQARFESALRILRSDLARDDAQSYRALEPWSRLERLSINVHGIDGLVVRARPSQERPLPMIVRAHAEVGGSALHVESESVVGRAEFGGAAIARFGAPERHREIALAWGSAWSVSLDEPRSAAIELAGEETKQALDELDLQFERQKSMPGRRRVRGSATAPGQAGPPPKVEVRQLKDLPDEVEFTVLLRDGAADAPKGFRDRPKAELRSEPKTRSKREARDLEQAEDRASVTAHRQYDSAQLQAQGWAYLQAAIEDGDIVVTDLQKERGVGADGTIDWKTFFEMKSFPREAPSSVTLTAMEFQRARDAKGSFFLVVVSGLERGFETELHVYADPLRTLAWSTQGSVSVSGLGAAKALVLKASPAPADAEAAAHQSPR